ncbi:hypothetical protein GCM10010218_36090 [Streptomyces mashuensis]|uniref:DUF4097 domain-containing protein n=1 Tax=Streptomyces mashuensis TaxID=33904 RepID=A0A919B4K5_9ACTN|nr:DUF4097 family beta strand repeat-containing protein [Streptomyces mashuensis]GHF51325.1 hypothetical protein GCM10010218_36090 [Streptomyces mashuensis]
MPDQSPWSLAEPAKLTFDGPVTALKARIIGGALNVVASDSGPARLELTEIKGAPLVVKLEDGLLTVGYPDLPGSFLKWLDRKSWKRSATVTLTVPTATRTDAGVVTADAVVSGISGATDVHSVSGDVTLVGVTGPVDAETVSGRLEAQSLGGDLRFKSVSGELTLVEHRSGTVKAESVGGDMTVDLAAGRHPELALTSVSGQIAIRLPQQVDAEVNANTTSGDVSCAFDDLRVEGQWGAKTITGRLGEGGGRLRVTTVSGAVALLRRPQEHEGKVL